MSLEGLEKNLQKNCLKVRMDRNWIWPQEVISDSSDRLKLRKFRTIEKPVVSPVWATRSLVIPGSGLTLVTYRDVQSIDWYGDAPTDCRKQVFRHDQMIRVQFRGDNESLEILKSIPISVSNQFHGAWANSKSKDQFHGFQYPWYSSLKEIQRRK